jgi:hypothetical protein
MSGEEQSGVDPSGFWDRIGNKESLSTAEEASCRPVVKKLAEHQVLTEME